TGLLAKIRPAVQATPYEGERSAKNSGFVDAVARKNVELTLTDIHRRSAVLADRKAQGQSRLLARCTTLKRDCSNSSVDAVQQRRSEAGIVTNPNRTAIGDLL